MTDTPDDKNKTAAASANSEVDAKLTEALKSFESYRDVVYQDGKLYRDPKTHQELKELSIGFGHHLPHNVDVAKLLAGKPSDPEEAKKWVLAKANRWLQEDIAHDKGVVEGWAQTHNVPLTNNEKDALADLVFNEGPGPVIGKTLTDGTHIPTELETALKSRAHKTPDKMEAANERIIAAIDQWDKMHVGDEIKTSSYLAQRRKLDEAMFSGDMAEVDTQIEWASQHNGTQHGLPVAHTHHKKSTPERS